MKAKGRKKTDEPEEPRVAKALHVIASKIRRADAEVRASESECKVPPHAIGGRKVPRRAIGRRKVPPHEIGAGQLGFFINEIEDIYKATENPAFAYEAVAVCLRHQEEVPEWAARVVAEGLEKLLTAGSRDESTALEDPLYLLGLRRKPGKQHVFGKYRTQILGLYTKRMRSHASDARDKRLRRKALPYAESLPKHFWVKGKRSW